MEGCDLNSMPRYFCRQQKVREPRPYQGWSGPRLRVTRSPMSLSEMREERVTGHEV
jgi:hypothetical protein